MLTLCTQPTVMTKCFDHYICPRNIYFRYSINSEADATVSLDNLEEIFTQY